jgi:hypothetical protein
LGKVVGEVVLFGLGYATERLNDGETCNATSAYQ